MRLKAAHVCHGAALLSKPSKVVVSCSCCPFWPAALIKNPGITNRELRALIPGPDFPTGELDGMPIGWAMVYCMSVHTHARLVAVVLSPLALNKEGPGILEVHRQERLCHCNNAFYVCSPCMPVRACVVCRGTCAQCFNVRA